MLSHCSCVWLCATLWTAACQAHLPMGFFKQEYWSGLLCPSPGDCPTQGSSPYPVSLPALTGRFFTTSTTWEALKDLHDSNYARCVLEHTSTNTRALIQSSSQPYEGGTIPFLEWAETWNLHNLPNVIQLRISEIPFQNNIYYLSDCTKSTCSHLSFPNPNHFYLYDFCLHPWH